MPLTHDLGGSAVLPFLTHRAETFPSQKQDEGSPGDGDDAEQRTQLRQFGRQRQRHEDNWRVGDQRGQGDLAAFA